MIRRIQTKLNDALRRIIPDTYVFAVLLTIVVAVIAFLATDQSALGIVQSWYKGFWLLLEFAMQVILILVISYAIALTGVVDRVIDKVATKVGSASALYITTVLIGSLLSLISLGWVALTAVYARKMAQRIQGVDYGFLIACVYISTLPWVCGLSSSIPLMLNSASNFLIESGVVDSTIPTDLTLGSGMNLIFILFSLIALPTIMFLLRPKQAIKEFDHWRDENETEIGITIKAEADGLKMKENSFSDALNNNSWIQLPIAVMGTSYLVWHFWDKGFQLDFNVMIMAFLVSAMVLHRTPMRMVIAMKRAGSNMSGIMLQYPFYAGIMGIVIYTGLGAQLAESLSRAATTTTYPLLSFIMGAVVNFAIPSAGGEFAVVGPSVLEAVKDLGAGLPPDRVTEMLARSSMSIAYGETLTNLLQPIVLLIILPILGAGTKIQARDIMGHLIVPFLLLLIIESAMVTWLPLNF